jgi:uncharacterized protein (TIGR04255 family)
LARKELKNKPLVESILEVKWRLEPVQAEFCGPKEMGPSRDPHYALLLGRLFERLKEEYPVHEQLPTANIPEGFVGQVVQHRFRSATGDWPLVQIGPGILTVNDTCKYTWSDFQERTRTAIVGLYDAHPDVAELRIQSLMLRYINAVGFDFREEDAFAFLRDKMKVTFGLPSSLFANTGVDNRPDRFSWQTTFSCSQPRGKVHISFATGQNDEQPAIFWETTVQSAGDDLPDMPDGFPEWVEDAHRITDDWFFKLIEGELERRFARD